MRKFAIPNLIVAASSFGFAAFEIVAERDWIEAAFFAAIALVSLGADFGRKKG